ncbi:MAG: UDP-N-acetylmuramate dehydrogenase [Rickettsiales bacterium]|jgi:UDP-N-acetylmuramate dehydrogenase|nr:UDP-N-acetylmuramate dehydrogenase [Rickettsiales bacterium]
MQSLSNIRSNFTRNESLAKYTNFGCGGVAQLLFTPENTDDLINFLRSEGRGQKITIIGGGTNLLVRDGGVDGVVIVTKKLNGIGLVNDNIVAECGVVNSRLSNFARNLDIGNFEFLGCIPGTVGGACRMNAGCYGSELKDILVSLDTVDPDGNVRAFSVDECALGYRKNGLPKDLIFLRATFRADIPRDRNESEEIFRKMLEEKLKTQPIGERTCGCTFKNPSSIPAWKIIKDVDLQGVDLNGAKFSEKHANFLINHGNCSSTDLENLITLAQSRVMDTMGIDLELEVEIIGNPNAAENRNA